MVDQCAGWTCDDTPDSAFVECSLSLSSKALHPASQTIKAIFFRMRYTLSLVMILSLSSLLLPAKAQSCYAPSALSFTSESGALWVNGAQFQLKGASWFGFETSDNVVQGLWAQSYTFFLDFLVNNGFNAIRVTPQPSRCPKARWYTYSFFFHKCLYTDAILPGACSQ